MNKRTKGLSVKAAAKLSGLSAHTLRAWERRYSVVEPNRSDTGRRVYSLAEVEKLKLLGLLTDRGYPIGNLVQMSLADLENLALQRPRQDDNAQIGPIQEGATDKFVGQYLDSLLIAVRTFNLEEIDRVILKSRLHMPARAFLIEVVSPLLTHVGHLVEKNKLDIAQEHALSAILRNHLGELLSQTQKTSDWASPDPNGLPRLIFSTPEGDLHEFGILMGAILAGTHGFKFRYFGPNMPAESLGNAAQAIGANIIILGSVKADSSRLVHNLKKYISLLSSSLAHRAGKDISIWIGGFCDFNVKTTQFATPVFHTGSFLDFEARLESLKARATNERGRP